MWRARFYKMLPKFLEDNPELVPVFLTLTVKNCPVSELRSQLDKMNAAFIRLTKRSGWPGVGWVKSVEVTRNPDTNEAHPHFHVLMFVQPGYFGKYYLSQVKWRELWKSCLKVDYLPVIHIKRVKSKKTDRVLHGDGTDSDPQVAALRIAILETLKYGVKPSDLVADANWLREVTEQLHKTRSVAVGGILKGYLREEEPDDLIHGDEGQEEELPPDALVLYFDWLSLVKRYIKVDPNLDAV